METVIDLTPNFWAGLLPPASPRAVDGLEAIGEVLVALSDGAPVPQRSAAFLAQALRPCLDGDNDIAGRLGLRAPGRGRAHQAPATLRKKLRRDELVRAVIDGMGPPMGASAMALQVLWTYCWAEDQKARPGHPQSFARICELARNHGKPLSHRQILRIANGEAAYSRAPKNDMKKA